MGPGTRRTSLLGKFPPGNSQVTQGTLLTWLLSLSSLPPKQLRLRLLFGLQLYPPWQSRSLFKWEWFGGKVDSSTPVTRLRSSGKERQGNEEGVCWNRPTGSLTGSHLGGSAFAVCSHPSGPFNRQFEAQTLFLLRNLKTTSYEGASFKKDPSHGRLLTHPFNSIHQAV